MIANIFAALPVYGSVKSKPLKAFTGTTRRDINDGNSDASALDLPYGRARLTDKKLQDKMVFKGDLKACHRTLT